MAPPQLASLLVPVAGGVGFNVMAVTASRFQISKVVIVNFLHPTSPAGKFWSPHLCRRGFLHSKKGTINSASGSGRLPIFETYLVHSLSSGPNIDKNSTPSLSFSGLMRSSPSISATYSGPRFFSSASIFLEQLIEQFEVSLLVGSLHLLAEFLYIAIGLYFGFVAADDSHDLLGVILGYPRLLSLREYRHGGDQRNSNNEPSVN